MESKNSIAKTANPNTVASRLRTICAVRLVPLLLLLTLPTVVQAQFNFTTNNDGSLNIANYTGSSANVIIPDTANGLPITSIGEEAFNLCTSLTSVTIPNSVTSIANFAFDFCYSLTNVTIGTHITSIGEDAFSNCTNLTSVTIPDSVSILGDFAFAYCYGLTNVTIGNGVTNFSIVFYYCTSLTSVTFGTNLTNIGGWAFANCFALTSITIPNSVTIIGNNAFVNCFSLTNVTIGTNVTSICWEAFLGCSSLTSITIPASVTNFVGSYAFNACTRLTSVYFLGNAPSANYPLFVNADNPVVYYLLGTTGWGAMFGGALTAPWNPQVQTSGAGFGVRTNQFGFNINWVSGRVIVVEACTNFANPVWQPVQTNTLTGSSCYFNDPARTNYPCRFYRLRSQ